MKKIISSLKRQIKALDLLHSLLKEEYKILCSTNKEGLSKNQFAIQQLISQLEKEKREILYMLKKDFKREKLIDLLYIIKDNEKSKEVSQLINELKSKEKLCMEQSTVNADLALAHLEQTKELVNFLYEQIKPKEKIVYSRYGKFNAKTSGPYVVNGRL